MKISLTRALTELKTLDARIKDFTMGRVPQFIDAYQERRGTTCATVMSKADFIKSANEKWQSLVDLKARRIAIKKAVLKANNTTTITVPGIDKPITIAEAIEMKKYMVDEENLIRILKKQVIDVNKSITDYNDQLDEKTPDNIKALVTDKKLNDDTVKKFIEEIKLVNRIDKVDPLDLVTLIDKMELSVVDFKSNIDFCLSEINAKTEIEIL